MKEDGLVPSEVQRSNSSTIASKKKKRKKKKKKKQHRNLESLSRVIQNSKDREEEAIYLRKIKIHEFIKDNLGVIIQCNKEIIEIMHRSDDFRNSYTVSHYRVEKLKAAIYRAEESNKRWHDILADPEKL